MSIFKKKNYRNKRYLYWIRDKCCSASMVEHQVVAHHVRVGQNGGTGLKPSDYRCIPLTDSKHKELHDGGERSFYQKHQIDPDAEIYHNLLNYIEMIKHDCIDYRKLIPLLEEVIDEMDMK